MDANIPERDSRDACFSDMTIADDKGPTEPEHSTALVCVVPQPGAAHPCPGVRHDPSFVTQLIATAADLPHTRLRRRASPTDARAAYLSSETIKPICAGHTQRIA